MNQKYFLIIMLVCFSILGNAQTVRFGYCSDEITTTIDAGSDDAISVAIAIPNAQYKVYAGKKITGIRIGLYADADNVTVFIKHTLNGTNLVLFQAGNLKAGWTEITLNEPFIIPERDIFIGYAATGCRQVGFSGNTQREGCWIFNKSWKNFVDVQHGSACIQALIDTEGKSVMDASLEGLSDGCSRINENFTVQGQVRNNSPEVITRLKVACQIAGNPSVECEIETSIAPHVSASLSLPVNAVSATGAYPLSVTLLEVNGVPDAYAGNNTQSSELTAYDRVFPRKVIMEEGTGTWCGWCTRGIVGMARMHAKYPESFIGIAIHVGDPMVVSNYAGPLAEKFFSGYPSMTINRKMTLRGDPFYDAERLYLSEMEIPSPIGLEAEAVFADDMKQTIMVTTNTVFSYSSNSVNMRLAYVLLENGVTGYTQSNAYAGGSEKMDGFEKLPALIPDIVYNDVARAIYDSFSGISGSIPASVTELVPEKYTHTITLPDAVSDKTKLELVVLLMNKDGEIVNADKTEIEEPTGFKPAVSGGISVYVSDKILNISSKALVKEVEIYSLSGRKIMSQKSGEKTVQLHTLSQGIYIVKIQTTEDVKVFTISISF
ncbi:MAG: Omp28-related outer membrane protein [Dysgonamonadaceae bacterium]|jgi:hypothetical protein|nr:Omp28-related outer membrane protein [Dysgonamonadaceae bacterium]